MNKLVLIIDDDEVFIEIIKRATREVKEISEILAASDGAAGIKQIKSRIASGDPLPDVVFVDINMPVLNGFGFLREFASLRKQHPELLNVRPIAMLTSSDRDQDRKMASDLGADRYIVKGMGLVEIRQGIVNCLS